ncbi:MAG: hypothetical protein IPP62_15540 [bacterium]|nr:hypothetical protein [bacterium]
MVLQSRWEPGAPLHDPFCGSATILTEAALIATHAAHALAHALSPMAWPDFDAARFAALRAEAEAAILPTSGLRLSGADVSPKWLRGRARQRGVCRVRRRHRAAVRDVAAMALEPGSWVVTNPPYGVRVGDEAKYAPVWQSFKDRLLEHPGTSVAVLGAAETVEKGLRLKPFLAQPPEQRFDPCVLAQYRIGER